MPKAPSGAGRSRLDCRGLGSESRERHVMRIVFAALALVGALALLHPVPAAYG